MHYFRKAGTKTGNTPDYLSLRSIILTQQLKILLNVYGWHGSTVGSNAASRHQDAQFDPKVVTSCVPPALIKSMGEPVSSRFPSTSQKHSGK